jgi:hypothetical protein
MSIQLKADLSAGKAMKVSTIRPLYIVCALTSQLVFGDPALSQSYRRLCQHIAVYPLLGVEL